MKFKELLTNIKISTINHSPELLLGAGIITGIGATVLACRATLSAKKIIDDANDKLGMVQEALDVKSDEYTEEDAKKDRKVVYISSAINVAKYYTPAVMVGCVSLACILSSYNVLNKRNAALTAALATATESFKRYRANVIEKYGEEIDKEMKLGIKTKTITKTDEEGNETTEEVKVVDDIDEYSSYSRFFDDGCIGWEKDPAYSLLFLKTQQSYANEKLRINGYLFLNDVYDMLGIPRSKAGQVVGWIYDEENPTGDNYVDFGIYDGHKENVRDFINGIENVILLDFNVDGNILDKAWRKGVK